MKRFVTITSIWTLAIFTHGCNSPISESKNRTNDTLETSRSTEDGIDEELTLLSDSTKILTKTYKDTWLNDYTQGTIRTEYVNKPGEILNYRLFSDDSLLFEAREINHGKYRVKGNCVILTRKNEADTLIYQDLIVLAPAFAGSTIISVICENSKDTVVRPQKLNSLTTTLKLNSSKCRDFLVTAQIFFHASTKPVKMVRKIN